jgi:hypothetical protein
MSTCWFRIIVFSFFASGRCGHPESAEFNREKVKDAEVIGVSRRVGAGCISGWRFPKLGAVNWTTTKVPLWQVDCENFRRTGRPFELRDVSAPEHLQFVNAFAARYELTVKEDRGSVRFEPAEMNRTSTASQPSILSP